MQAKSEITIKFSGSLPEANLYLGATLTFWAGDRGIEMIELRVL